MEREDGGEPPLPVPGAAVAGRDPPPTVALAAAGCADRREDLERVVTIVAVGGRPAPVPDTKIRAEAVGCAVDGREAGIVEAAFCSTGSMSLMKKTKKQQNHLGVSS